MVTQSQSFNLPRLGKNSLAKSEDVPKTGMLEQFDDGSLTKMTHPLYHNNVCVCAIMCIYLKDYSLNIDYK